MDTALENTRKLMFEALEKAKKANRLTESAKRRLNSFSVVARVLFYTKFNGLRKKLKAQEWQRFACTAVAMNLSRRIKHYERAKKVKAQ